MQGQHSAPWIAGIAWSSSLATNSHCVTSQSLQMPRPVVLQSKAHAVPQAIATLTASRARDGCIRCTVRAQPPLHHSTACNVACPHQEPSAARHCTTQPGTHPSPLQQTPFYCWSCQACSRAGHQVYLSQSRGQQQCKAHAVLGAWGAAAQLRPRPPRPPWGAPAGMPVDCMRMPRPPPP